MQVYVFVDSIWVQFTNGDRLENLLLKKLLGVSNFEKH